MLTKTSVSAIRALLHLALRNSSRPVPPREIARCLGESPSYLSKVTAQLVKAGILRAHRGVAGGVVLARSPETVTVLSIVEVCQGVILGNFCQGVAAPSEVCAFHRAGAELHDAIVGVLSRWTLADLAAKPCPTRKAAKQDSCWLEPLGVETVVRNRKRARATGRRARSAKGK